MRLTWRPSDKQPAPERLGELDQAAANAFEGEILAVYAQQMVIMDAGSAAMPRLPVILRPSTFQRA